MADQMPPLSPAQVSDVDKWGTHWPVVLASMGGMGTGAGLYQYLSSLFIGPLEAQYGWSRSDLTTASGIGLLGSLASPLIGWLADRHGARTVASVCVVGLIIAYLGFSAMTGPVWQFFLFSGLLGLMSGGTTSLVYMRPMVSRFVRHRGFAMGITTSGLSLAALLVAPVAALSIDRWGVQGGYALLIVLAVFIGLPSIWCLGSSSIDPSGQANSVEGSRTSLSGALRSRDFWLLVIAMICVNVPAGGVLTQFVVLLTNLGHDAGRAEWLLSFFVGSVLVGRLLIGWLFDRIDARLVAALVTALGAIACLSLPLSNVMVVALPCIVALGLMQGAESDILSYFVAKHFGGYRFSTIYGTIFTAGLLATAAGIIGFGRVYDHLGGYRPAMWISAVFLMIASCCYLALTRPESDVRLR